VRSPYRRRRDQHFASDRAGNFIASPGRQLKSDELRRGDRSPVAIARSSGRSVVSRRLEAIGAGSLAGAPKPA
jgi:hypothetical protein